MYLYIHIPYCTKKCNYCDFVTFGDVSGKDEYVDLLVREIKLLSLVHPCKLKTLYLGGGTPSLLSEKNIFDIFHAVTKHFNLPSEEVTIELNPEDCSLEKLKFLKKIGFNRVSIGIQSFDDEVLRFIGREGSRELSMRACETIVEAGFDNFSMDLIYGIPNQSMKSLADSIECMLKYSPTHISTYSLMINKGTKLYSQWKNAEFTDLKEDEIADQFDYIVETLKKYDYNRYEISNFSKPSYEARHNSAYWDMKDTLGAGISAVYTSSAKRYENTYSYKNYKKMIFSGQLPIGNTYDLSPDDRLKERIMMGFRLARGIEIEEINRNYGIDFLQRYSKQIHKFEKLKLLKVNDGRVFLNNKGMNVSNSIICDFIL